MLARFALSLSVGSGARVLVAECVPHPHMKKLKSNALVENIEHFDNQIDLADSEGLGGMKVDNIKPQRLFRRPRWSRCRGLPPAEGAR